MELKRERGCCCFWLKASDGEYYYASNSGGCGGSGTTTRKLATKTSILALPRGDPVQMPKMRSVGK